MDASLNDSDVTFNGTSDEPIDLLSTISRTASSVAILANIAFLIWIHREKLIPGTIPRMLITNLCVSDCFACAMNILHYTVNDQIEVPLNWLGMVICRLTHGWFLYWAVCQASVNNIMLLNVERYLSVLHPSTYRRLTVGFVRLMIFLSWLLGAVLMSFLLFRADRVENRCVKVAFPAAVNQIRSIIRVMMLFIVPLIVTVYCNLRVVLKLRWYSRMLSLGQRNHESQRVIVCFTFSIGMAFVCFFGPESLFHFVDINVIKVTTNRDFYFNLLGLLLDGHSVTNPILYFVTLNRCCCRRKELTLHCCKKLRKSESTQITQASVVYKNNGAVADKPSVY